MIITELIRPHADTHTKNNNCTGGDATPIPHLWGQGVACCLHHCFVTLHITHYERCFQPHVTTAVVVRRRCRAAARRAGESRSTPSSSSTSVSRPLLRSIHLLLTETESEGKTQTMGEKERRLHDFTVYFLRNLDWSGNLVRSFIRPLSAAILLNAPSISPR